MQPGVLFDPLVPREEGLEWFSSRPASPQAILLSNRHHYRESDRFAERFGCRGALQQRGPARVLPRRGRCEGFDVGEELPGGVLACELDAICPDDTALHLPAHSARW